MKTAPEKLFARLGRYSRFARALLLWETYGPVLAAGLLAAALFITGALTGLWERIGDPWRLIALLATLFFMARSLHKSLKLRFPTQSDAQRRVEFDSGQKHRPIDVLADRPALAVEAWPAHYQKAYQQASQIKPPKRRDVLSPQDPYFLRYAAPLVLGCAMIYAAGFGFERIKRAVAPSWQSAIHPSKISFEAWIDPPAYTGRPPIYFKDGTKVAVPVGSEFVARISGSSNPPRPKLWQQSRGQFLPLTQLGQQSFEVRAMIDHDAKAEWRIGTRRKTWTLNTSPDTPPEVDFVDPPEADKRDRLVFTYRLNDDYGVEDLKIEMAEIIDGQSEVELFSNTLEYASVPLSSGSVKETDNTSAALDLTKHSWAGRKVIGRLVATDGAGQTAKSEPVYFTVPDKIFVEPLAKAIVEHRQLVIAGQNMAYEPEPRRTAAMGYFNTYEPELRLDRAPATIQRAALLIDVVTDAPDDIFKDPAVYMGLRNVHARLRYADETADLKGIPEDLWKIALRAEFGVLGTALEEMREAEAALREGIARRAPQREIDTLFSRYNQAVENYTEELRRKAMEEGNFAEGGGGGGGAMGSVDEIQELLDAIEAANKAGDTEGARRALAKLAALLENMEIQLAQGGGGEGGEGMEGEMSEEMKKSLEDLADMMGDQRDIQDETRQAERDEGEDSLSPQELAERQAELEDLLEKLAESLPEDLASAGQAGGGEDRENGGNSQGGENQGGETDGGETEGGNAGQGQEESRAGLEPGGSENAQGGGNEAGPPGSGPGSAGRNEPSGKSVEELLNDARRAMRESEDGLQAGRLGEAGRAQAEVLRELREAGKLLAEAAGGQQSGEEGEGESDDPLGRSDDGFNSENSEADIELRDNATRSRELLEELRRRAGEQAREKEEREYLERLLNQY